MRLTSDQLCQQILLSLCKYLQLSRPAVMKGRKLRGRGQGEGQDQLGKIGMMDRCIDGWMDEWMDG